MKMNLERVQVQIGHWVL